MYNENGEFDQTIFSKSRNFKDFKSVTVLNKDLLLKDINEFIDNISRGAGEVCVRNYFMKMEYIFTAH